VTQRIPRALQAISTFTQLRLSPREVEACRWIIEGLQRPEIAERMHVAESTVRSSIKSVYARLGIGSREQLVSLALQAFSVKAQAS
jgi:DNA-binding CsgD family transcriptional regulator